MLKPKVHIVYLCSPKVLAATRTWGAMNTHRLQVVISKYHIFIQRTRGSLRKWPHAYLGGRISGASGVTRYARLFSVCSTPVGLHLMKGLCFPCLKPEEKVPSQPQRRHWFNG